MTTHIMVDTETLATRPGAIVMSVALVRFSDEAHVQINLSVPEQRAAGLFADPQTEAWWQQQPGQAWQAATANPVAVVPALQYIDAWIKWASGGADFLIWCHGATFDAPLLGEMYRVFNVPCPWQFWEVRDTRTLYDLAAVNVKDYAVPPPHIALNDAIGQVRAANAALAVLARAHGRAAA